MSASSLAALSRSCLALLTMAQGAPIDPVTKAFELLNHGKYLAALKTCEDLRPSADVVQSLATFRSIVGDDEGAMAAMEWSESKAQPPPAIPTHLPLDAATPVDALATIVAEANKHRVVIINEAHHVPQHRAFSLALARALRRHGFAYFAAETLNNADMIDLKQRGYPTQTTGFYTNEPAYGDLIRQAVKLGYTPIAYETESQDRTGDSTDRIIARETDQCRNLVDRIFAKDPSARVLIHVGYDHATEDTKTLSDGRQVAWMAAQLRRATGIDPLTIDQTTQTQGSTPEVSSLEWRYAQSKGWLTTPVVFRNRDASYFVGGNYHGRMDVQVFHPAVTLVDGRPDWLAMGDYRLPVEIPVEVEPKSGRVLMQAFVASESDAAIPIDQVLVSAGELAPVLMLPKGEYRLVVQNEHGDEVARMALTN